MEKTCTKCKETKILSLFKADSRYKGGYSSYCKSCHTAATRNWQKKNPDRLREYVRKRYKSKKDAINEKRKASYTTERARPSRLKYLYKMSIEEYDGILKAQDGVCAICKEPPYSQRYMSVDHDHSCCETTPTCGNCTRGLLCTPCNTALNALEKRGDWLTRALDYLQETQYGNTKGLRSDFRCDGCDG